MEADASLASTDEVSNEIRDAESATAAGNGNAKAPAPKSKGPKAKEDEPPFWEFLYSQGDRWTTDGLKLYLWRVWPKIDSGEQHHYISTLREPADEEFVQQNFGSGRYLIMLKDARRKLIRQHAFSIHNQQFPPRLDEAEVLRVPENDLYFKVWAKKTNGSTGKSDKEPPAQSDMNAVLTTVLTKSNSFDPKLADLWERTAKERDELSKELAERHAPPDLLAVAQKIKELFPVQPPPPSPSADKSDLLALITAIKGMQQDPLALMQQAKELFAPPPAEVRGEPERDEIDRLDKVLGFAQKLAAIRVPNAGNRSNWDIGLEFARELGTPLMQMVNNFMVLRSQAKGAPQPGVPSAAAAAAPASFDPYANPDALRQHARNVNAQGATPPPAASGDHGAAASAATASAAPQGTPAPNEIVALLANYGGLILNALNTGVDGAEFADNISRLFGGATYALVANHGEDLLTQSMLSMPELAMFGESRLRKFAYEFVHFEEILESDVEEEDAEEKPSKVARMSAKGNGVPA